MLIAGRDSRQDRYTATNFLRRLHITYDFLKLSSRYVRKPVIEVKNTPYREHHRQLTRDEANSAGRNVTFDVRTHKVLSGRSMPERAEETNKMRAVAG
ncbi:hypothetical protein EVAR_82735_1 [Eumeta japonica]|uniref:Uncharacterized protein n=1 Tax=Eumeta variegata TaxID=151549 RepID=A0A4C1ZMG8_EUMVA|nr:hypothetical protein EVAR_82735_1 [Eumeta japonica]